MDTVWLLRGALVLLLAGCLGACEGATHGPVDAGPQPEASQPDESERDSTRSDPRAMDAATSEELDSSSPSAASDGSANENPPVGDGDAADAADAWVDMRPLPTGPSFDAGPANVPEFKPAFPEQTRAPSMKTQTQFDLVQVASGFDEPWAIAFMADGRMLVTEKPTGKLYIVTNTGAKTEVTGLPAVDGRAQGGLLDIDLGPDYSSSGLIYWTYYEPRQGGNGLAVARGKLNDVATPSVSDVQVIFRMQPTINSTQHAGGRLVFTPDGMLVVTLGDRSVLEGRVQAQRLDSHLGKIVRIALDGGVPQDNPYAAAQGSRPEVWSSGHRNILGAALDPQNRLWVVEMGPQGGDELNLIVRGKDYGWPTIGYGEEYTGESIHRSTQAPGLEQPVYYWDPVIAPSSLTIYTGSLFSEWRGDFLIGGLSSRALIRLMVRNDKVVGEERLLMDQHTRIREVAQGPDGALYLLTDVDQKGLLLRLAPKTGGLSQ